MVRIEIPALYRLDVGSSKWGWHKMSDLIESVNNLLERASLDNIGHSETHTFCRTKPGYMCGICAYEMIERFAFLNDGKPFVLSNNREVWTTKDPSRMSFDDNFFVLARWGMRVIIEVKQMIAKESRNTKRTRGRACSGK